MEDKNHKEDALNKARTKMSISGRGTRHQTKRQTDRQTIERDQNKALQKANKLNNLKYTYNCRNGYVSIKQFLEILHQVLTQVLFSF
jgi:hypothetical protein